MINISCSCGYTADMGDFCRTTLAGDLPPGQFQCPSCHAAWRRVALPGDYRVLKAGRERLYIPERVVVVGCEARL